MDLRQAGSAELALSAPRFLAIKILSEHALDYIIAIILEVLKVP